MHVFDDAGDDRKLVFPFAFLLHAGVVHFADIVGEVRLAASRAANDFTALFTGALRQRIAIDWRQLLRAAAA